LVGKYKSFLLKVISKVNNKVGVILMLNISQFRSVPCKYRLLTILQVFDITKATDFEYENFDNNCSDQINLLCRKHVMVLFVFTKFHENFCPKNFDQVPIVV
jgi:hypothetical protein